MASLDFPSNPTNGQTYALNGVTYYYNSSIGAWLTQLTSMNLSTSSNTQVLFNDAGLANGSSGFVFDKTTGNLGLGTSGSPYKFSVANNIQLFATGTTSTVNFGSLNNNSFAKIEHDDSNGDLNFNVTRSYNMKFYTNNTERMRIDSSGNMGIGTISPSSYSSKLAVVGGQTSLVGNASYNPLYLMQTGGSSGYTINCENFNTSGATSYGGIGFAARGSNPYSGYYGALRFNWSIGGIWQFVDASENLTNISVSGVKFPATQSASSDVNTLDDYEEGTWTPTDSSGAGLTLVTPSGHYIKVGKLVFISWELTFPSTANTNAVRIGGLPFTYESSGGQYTGSMSICNHGNSNIMAMVSHENAGCIQFRDYNNGNYSNANLSGKFYYGSAMYKCTS